jgi:RNA recognition motif-containing protein
MTDVQNTIFVGNLPFTVDDEALAEIFTNLSIKVKSAKVITGVRRPRDETRPFRGSKGFGFVEVEDPAQQQEAVDKVAGTLVGDREISAKIANEMRPIEKEAVETIADIQA